MMKNFIDKYIATLITIPIIGLHFITSDFGGASLLIFISDMISNMSFIYLSYFQSIKPSVLLISANLLLFLIFGALYYFFLKIDKKVLEFRIGSLILYNITLLLAIHQLYNLLVIIIKDSTMNFGIDEIGIMNVAYQSCFIFPIFGMIIDFIKNTNGVPEVKF